MKNKILSFIAVTAIALTAFSCSDDDNTIPQETNKLLGKWNFIEFEGLDAEGKVVETFIEDNGVCPFDYDDFLENGTVHTIAYGYNENVEDCDYEEAIGTWKIEDTKFTTTYGSTTDVYTIVKLTTDTFEIQAPLTEDAIGHFDPKIVSFKSIYKKTN